MTFINKRVIVLYLLIGVCYSANNDNDETVEEFSEAIDNFIEATKKFQYPIDSREYLNGKNENAVLQDCETTEPYDFIIVGAGSSGTVLANRLSEISDWRVLLIEAGANETIVSDIPAMADYLRLSRFNWGYKSVPQHNSLQGYVNNSEVVARGKTMGGCSTINLMMYVRGNHKDYDKWESEGNPGWSYRDVLPYFRKSEDAHLPNPDVGYHGEHGDLSVEQMNYLSPLTSAYLAANQELGRKILFDFNGKFERGFSRLQTTTKHGRRDSGSKAFIDPIINQRNNLKISSNTLVTKLLINGTSVNGVQYVKNGKCFTTFTLKEVILSSGAINTPQLLMLSGIGAKEDLEKHNITVVKDLKGVGENLWDHIFNFLQPFTTNYTWQDPPQTEAIKEYLKGKGYLTTADYNQDIGFVNVNSNDKSRPDIEHIFRASQVLNLTYEYYQQTRDFTLDTYNSVVKPLIGKTTWSSYTVLLHPKSRGTIKLKSNSPFDFPLIDPNYFSDPKQEDINTLVAALKDVIKISQTSSMQKYDSQMFKIDLPNCKQFVFGVDNYFKCLVQNLASSISHFSGTCKMGPRTNEMAVVDKQLKVYGIKNLRIADCSVLPVTISGHTNAVAFMIGEKAADIIKKHHKVK